jgi:hypothetical protein
MCCTRIYVRAFNPLSTRRGCPRDRAPLVRVTIRAVHATEVATTTTTAHVVTITCLRARGVDNPRHPRDPPPQLAQQLAMEPIGVEDARGAPCGGVDDTAGAGCQILLPNAMCVEEKRAGGVEGVTDLPAQERRLRATDRGMGRCKGRTMVRLEMHV